MAHHSSIFLKSSYLKSKTSSSLIYNLISVRLALIRVMIIWLLHVYLCYKTWKEIHIHIERGKKDYKFLHIIIIKIITLFYKKQFLIYFYMKHFYKIDIFHMHHYFIQKMFFIYFLLSSFIKITSLYKGKQIL